MYQAGDRIRIFGPVPSINAHSRNCRRDRDNFPGGWNFPAHKFGCPKPGNRRRPQNSWNRRPPPLRLACPPQLTFLPFLDDALPRAFQFPFWDFLANFCRHLSLSALHHNLLQRNLWRKSGRNEKRKCYFWKFLIPSRYTPSVFDLSLRSLFFDFPVDFSNLLEMTWCGISVHLELSRYISHPDSVLQAVWFFSETHLIHSNQFQPKARYAECLVMRCINFSPLFHPKNTLLCWNVSAYMQLLHFLPMDKLKRGIRL